MGLFLCEDNLIRFGTATWDVPGKNNNDENNNDALSWPSPSVYRYIKNRNVRDDHNRGRGVSNTMSDKSEYFSKAELLNERKSTDAEMINLTSPVTEIRHSIKRQENFFLIDFFVKSRLQSIKHPTDSENKRQFPSTKIISDKDQ